MLAAMVIWLGMLFIWLGVSASEYFSPNIGTLAVLLHLPESLAGVTLLALGNGAPDLFSTFSAVRAGSGALAIGQLVGSASFIVSVVAGATTLIVPQYKVNRISYLRELVFFVATISIVVVIIVTERLSRGLALCMVGLYIAYVITVVATTYYEELAAEEHQQICITLDAPGEPAPVESGASLLTQCYPQSHESLLIGGDAGRARSFGSSSSALLSESSGRRQAIDATCDEHSNEDVWAPCLLDDRSLSSRALCEFLHQHRKSLLAAAECSDIIGELRESQSFIGTRVCSSSNLGASLANSARGSAQNVLAMHNKVRPVSPPWDENLASCSEDCPAGGAHSGSSALSERLAFDFASDAALNYLQIVHTRALLPSEPRLALDPPSTIGWSTHNSTYLSPTSCRHTCLSPAPQLQRHDCGHLIAPYSALEPLLTVQSQSMIPALALAHACIPTLRYWKDDASMPLKAFIVFSALPVFLLTLTVPVMREAPPTHHDNACDHAQSTSFARSSNEGEILLRQEQQSNYQSICADQQNIQLSPAMSAVHHSCCVGLGQTLLAEATQQAERAVSFVRSVVAVVFLYVALYLGGYCIHKVGLATHACVVAGLSMASLLGNYLCQRRFRLPYWLQVTPCFVGFFCGLAWVYIVADEMVSITQALGVILDLSEEILGLTIVGFGNSLGDLVTNLTLARMGFPMMAISACFGGPMLCILLGVGMAACGTISMGEAGGSAYWIPLTSPTVLVSAACLLFNSVLFLVVVPRQKYHMTRSVGLVALAVYFVSMAVNVYIEK
ncbi:hypothetical protein LPJ66_004083 [Kickxella alabastrina]|uniref:Uncharacterized protein n=1 Tax=Kickxella alabastrina TaxID=61397 RepID=A0ACC1IJN2_9FUNG|nr:hypothetical protein LPJ66_004083 [Kickxella alabastrina]